MTQQEQFENSLLTELSSRLKSGHYDPVYHVKKYTKGVKKGNYVNPETQLAWNWYQRGRTTI